MERNIGDQLNKAFEAYRQVSIEKDNAKKELQQMVMTWGENVFKLKSQNSLHCQCRKKGFVTHSLELCLLVLFLCFNSQVTRNHFLKT